MRPRDSLLEAILALKALDARISVNEIVLIGVTAAAVLSLLDTFSPTISSGARNGMGLGLGLQTVGYSGPFLPYNV